MSLLDRGPHTAIVTTFTRSDVEDEDGENPRIENPPVTVSGCSFRPLDADEIKAFGGTLADTSYKVTHRDWPGGPYSIVEWEGMKFEQVGDTLLNLRGKRTRHTSAFLRTTMAKVR